MTVVVSFSTMYACHHAQLTTLLQMIIYAVSKPPLLYLTRCIQYTLLFSTVCDISECTDPGYGPNNDCNHCVVTDICLADNPCMNNGNCILNSAPNDYTCDCAPGFTGINCDTSGKCYSFYT